MGSSLLRCSKCNRYNIQQKCSECGGNCVIPKPPKYSPEDKYAEYRRKAKKDAQEQ